MDPRDPDQPCRNVEDSVLADARTSHIAVLLDREAA
jgi:hypothetical protein